MKMYKGSKKLKKGLKKYVRSPKNRYALVALGAVFIILLILVSRHLVANQQEILSDMNVTPTISQPTPTITITPTNTPVMKLRKSVTIQPTATTNATTKPTSNNNTNNQSPTATPQPTSTPSLPTLTAQNGAEFTFQVGYDSQFGYTPPEPNYDKSYLQFLYSAVTNPNYKPGDHVDEEFHFKALKTGETTLEVTRRDSTTKYRVVIQ